MRIGERVLELEDVRDVGAAEAVDRIVGDDSVGDEVVGVLDVEVVDGGVSQLDALDGFDAVVAAVAVEHPHARADLGRLSERERLFASQVGRGLNGKAGKGGGDSLRRRKAAGQGLGPAVTHERYRGASAQRYLQGRVGDIS